MCLCYLWNYFFEFKRCVVCIKEFLAAFIPEIDKLQFNLDYAVAVRLILSVRVYSFS